MELIGSLKTYEWGKLGIKSTVAQLQSANLQSFVPEENVAYAELWMGTHGSGPAICKSDGKAINEVLREPLAFLFKVLSIRKALSIQVHPNKREAERLHSERPDVYQDPNHKPELAIALTPFTALCGFRPIPEIVQFLTDMPPLAQLVGEDNANNLKQQNSENLKICYTKLMTSDEISIRKCIIDILDNHCSVLDANNLRDIFTTINKDFPGDVGCLSIFFLNVLRLKPGQAIYLGANEIHAYLEGDCIECMACSDNVIRAGLTPKYKDVEQLISSVNYNCVEAFKHIYFPYRIDDCLKLFIPPVDDFAVGEISLTSANKDYKVEVPETHSILLTIDGERELVITINGKAKIISLTRGSIVYIPPEAAPEIIFKSNGDCNYLGYMALKNTFRHA